MNRFRRHAFSAICAVLHLTEYQIFPISGNNINLALSTVIIILQDLIALLLKIFSCNLLVSGTHRTLILLVILLSFFHRYKLLLSYSVNPSITTPMTQILYVFVDKTHPMDRCRSQLLQSLNMCFGSISFIFRKVISRINYIIFFHHTVPCNFRNNTCRCDRCTFCISFDDRNLFDLNIWNCDCIIQ